jgi:hypothetical protein
MKNIFLAIYTFAFLFAAVHFIPTGKKVESDFYEGYPESAEGSKKGDERLFL